MWRRTKSDLRLEILWQHGKTRKVKFSLAVLFNQFYLWAWRRQQQKEKQEGQGQCLEGAIHRYKASWTTVQWPPLNVYKLDGIFQQMFQDDNPIKCLGKWLDETLTDRNQPKEIKPILCLKKVGIFDLPEKCKAWNPARFGVDAVYL